MSIVAKGGCRLSEEDDAGTKSQSLVGEAASRGNGFGSAEG
ncbi:hypothetical protein [Methylorubrum extorquens]|nr:hypothetical protein [Methylorubrum extorquens]UYW25613.1 hypothetical protein OKC48_20400 [Methylorubrum extorquens]UYW34529.1 hypothetical protein OKB92_10750 [Methylorubrum extorquens]